MNMKTNIKEVNELIEKQTNEVARLRELLKVYEAAKKLNESSFNIVIKENTKLSDRLNQSLGYAKDALFFARTYENKSQWNKIDESWEKVRELEKEILAPAPEEPVIQDSRITEPVSTPTDLNKPNKENTLSLNDWRELGKDEVICEGDKYRSDVSFSNWPVSSVMIGKPARNFPEYSFRTRRPLPKIQVIREKMSPEKAEEVRKIRLLIGEEELEQIANTPEPAPDKNTELNTDKNTEQPASNSEWRPLGEDEVICEGDEYLSMSEEWRPVELSLGQKVSDSALGIVRTRRPLPKPKDEPAPDNEVALYTPKIDRAAFALEKYYYANDGAAEIAEALIEIRDILDSLATSSNK